MENNRISSMDLGYQTGMLSLFPEAIDTPKQLYVVTNNAETILKQSLSYNGKYIIVDDNSSFPENGIIRIGNPIGQPGNFELVYYDQKTTGVFRNLIRGFAGSRQLQWTAGSTITAGVMAEHHNGKKDAILKIEEKIGIESFPDEESLNGILNELENRFLAPKALFRAYPIKGLPGTSIRFQNFSTGALVKFLWDFGDGTTSVEKHPIHVYQNEGIYSIKLNVITTSGAQGIVTKSNYISIDKQETVPFFYVTPVEGYSIETAERLNVEPTEFTFVDQTDGDILQRYWIFDGTGESNGTVIDSQNITEYDPNKHVVKFTYDKSGSYEPSLLVLFANQKLRRSFLKNIITVN